MKEKLLELLNDPIYFARSRRGLLRETNLTVEEFNKIVAFLNVKRYRANIHDELVWMYVLTERLEKYWHWKDKFASVYLGNITVTNKTVEKWNLREFKK